MLRSAGERGVSESQSVGRGRGATIIRRSGDARTVGAPYPSSGGTVAVRIGSRGGTKPCRQLRRSEPPWRRTGTAIWDTFGVNPSEVVVRTARPEDLDGIVTVLATKRPGSITSNVPNQRQRETWTEVLERPGLTTYVAVVGGQVVGTATLLTMPNLTYDCAPTAF